LENTNLFFLLIKDSTLAARNRIMTYKDTIDFLYTQLPMYQKSGKAAFKKDLGNIKALCKHLGNPHKHFRSIHIAGTNGKGTTSHILSGLFQAEGLKVGLYTSPHYKDFRERIKINGEYISKKSVRDFVKDILPTLETIQASFFEITVAMAFQYFKIENVDIAIIETGLGGRLDSTNIITPELSVITNISLDHTNMLGNTVTAIAKEKAGIIKKNTPVIIGERQNEVFDVFKKKANKTKSKIYKASSICKLQQTKESLHASQYEIKLRKLTCTAKSSFAYAIFKQNSNEDLSATVIKKALINLHQLTAYQGRWQVKRKIPLTILDSAHNVAGLKYVTDRLSKIESNSLHIVIGFVSDKNWKELLQLFPRDAHYYFCKAKIRRALNAEDINSYAKTIGIKGKTYKTVSGAERAALRKAKHKDIVFIGGSTFVVAEAL